MIRRTWKEKRSPLSFELPPHLLDSMIYYLTNGGQFKFRRDISIEANIFRAGR